MTMVVEAGVLVPPDLRLTRYAAGARYAVFEGLTEEEFREAVALAEAVVGWAEDLIARRPGKSKKGPEVGTGYAGAAA